MPSLLVRCGIRLRIETQRWLAYAKSWTKPDGQRKRRKLRWVMNSSWLAAPLLLLLLSLPALSIDASATICHWRVRLLSLMDS